MKKEITNDPTKPFKRVYNYAIQRDVRYVDPTDIPEFHFLRSSLSRTRSILLPDIPYDVDDVILEREWKRTWNGKKVLSYQDNNWEFLYLRPRRTINAWKGAMLFMPMEHLKPVLLHIHSL